MTNVELERLKRCAAKAITKSKALRPTEAIRESARAGASEGAPRAAMHESAAKDVIASVLERMPSDEVPDPAAFQRALALVYEHGVPAYRNLVTGNAAAVSPDQLAALEAVVEADGSRPSLLVRNGVVESNHPLAGSWTDEIDVAKDFIARVSPSIGRVQPLSGSGANFFGTATVVDAGKGLVLTNWHVVEAMCRRQTTIYESKGKGRFRFFDGVCIDFAAESGAQQPNLFKIVEAQTSNVDGTGFARLDAAVLRIEPMAAQNIPRAVRISADAEGPSGNLASLCLISHPGRPQLAGGIETFNGRRIDWAWVATTLFGNRFGVKRLSPGEVDTAVGLLNDPPDPRKWTFAHDSTSLGGASGALIWSWTNPNPVAFGLHFAGATLHGNYAHAISACVETLRAIGVPVADAGAPVAEETAVVHEPVVQSIGDDDDHGETESAVTTEAAPSWRVARALLKLREQVNAKAPNRKTDSDGTIGDDAHAKTDSDHNPRIKDGAVGVVTAMDITNDPARGCSAQAIADAIVAARDRRVKYVIWNKQIVSATVKPWQWRPYTKKNPHTKHVHISVRPEKDLYDDQTPWSL